MPQIHGLMYYSFADPEFDENVLAFIMARARMRNARAQVTGQLHYENGLFLQWFEGRAQRVDEIFAHIERDPHHSGIKTLYRGPVPRRSFDGWDMAYSNGKDSSLLSFMRHHDLSFSSCDMSTFVRLMEFLANVGLSENQKSDHLKLSLHEAGVSLNDYVMVT